MDRAPMPKWLKIVIAIGACAIVIIGYSVLSVALGFKHGGGYLVLILLFSLLGGIWRSIVGSGKDNEENEVKAEDAFQSDTPTQQEPVAEEHESPFSNWASKTTDKVMANMPPQASKTVEEASKPEYHIVLKVLLLIFMIVGIIMMIYQAINDFTWENYTVGWVRIISSLIGLAGFILLYMKKLLGYIIIVSVLAFSIIYSAIMHDSGLGMVIIAAVFRLVVISLILFIRKDGVSAWSILLHKHTDTLNEIKETFPVKPFLYIEKMPEEKSAETQQQKNNFENWLNS